jgi:hypothetical protein
MLSIKSAILYKTGIGYFERSGKVDLSKSHKIVLSFKKKIMNDVLASLSVSSKDALVTGVSYEGHDIDLDRALEDCLIKVPEYDSFVALLKQLIGSKIEIVLGNEKIAGIVLGIQNYEKGVEGTEDKIMEPYLVLSDEKGEIKNIAISDMTGSNAQFSLSDEKMNKELIYFMETIYTSKKRDAKSMTVFLEPKSGGISQAEVSISYLHEVPSWKASYRLLIFPNEVSIQCFGLIDNPTDEDWNEINLSLVAGLPVSFLYDLYSPNWIRRPTVARREKYDITPAQFEESLAHEKYPVDDITTMTSEAMAPMEGFMQMGEKHKKGSSLEAVLKSTKVSATGTEGGDFFQYQITVPITVKRNESSLVPILQEKISSKRISVYNEKVRRDNPMLTMELTNDTGLTLEEGPISVFEVDNYAGEAMLPFLKKDEKRRIGYAVDLGVFVSKKQEDESLKFHRIKIAHYIEAFQYHIKKVEYTIKNKTDDPRDVVIEHPKEHGYELFETPDPFEESKNFYRYNVQVAPQSSERLKINTRSVISEYRYYNDVSKHEIEEWHNLKLIDDKTRDFLMHVWKVTTELRDVQNEIYAKNEEKNKISTDQNRLRQNIKVLKKSHSESQLREKYVKKLETQEELLENIDKEIEKLNKRVESLQYIINALNKLDYKDATSLNNIGWGFWLVGEGEIVVEYARKALELDAEKGFIWDTLACGLYKIGKIKESYDAFQKAIELSAKGEENITQEIYEKVKKEYVA